MEDDCVGRPAEPIRCSEGVGENGTAALQAREREDGTNMEGAQGARARPAGASRAERGSLIDKRPHDSIARQRSPIGPSSSLMDRRNRR